MGARHDILTDRVNAEPPILRGCSSTELGVLLLASAGVWVPMSLFVGALLGAAFAGLGVAGVLIVGTVYVGATWLQKIKRGRPDGYYLQRLIVFLHDHRLHASGLCRRSGVWDIGRRN